MKESRGIIRHNILVRVSHWLNTLAFVALIVSGVAILMAHPRLYWGEAGGAGSPAILELPLPLNLDQSGWGRSLHFLAAWVCVLDGAVYLASGLRTPPLKNKQYGSLQFSTYVAVVFVLFPLMIASGLAMSPAFNAAFPWFVNAFGGHQSSRTIHFIIANLLVLFLNVHVIMVYRAGFRERMRGMVTG